MNQKDTDFSPVFLVIFAAVAALYFVWGLVLYWV
jgi:hypothetical protein